MNDSTEFDFRTLPPQNLEPVFVPALQSSSRSQGRGDLANALQGGCS